MALHETLFEASYAEISPRFSVAILLGMFFASWIENDYAALVRLMEFVPGTDMAFGVAPARSEVATAKRESADEQSDAAEEDSDGAGAAVPSPKPSEQHALVVDQFFAEVIRVMAFNAFLRKLCAVTLPSLAEEKHQQPPPLEKIVARLNAAPLLGALSLFR